MPEDGHSPWLASKLPLGVKFEPTSGNAHRSVFDNKVECRPSNCNSDSAVVHLAVVIGTDDHDVGCSEGSDFFFRDWHNVVSFNVRLAPRFQETKWLMSQRRANLTFGLFYFCANATALDVSTDALTSGLAFMYFF